MHYTRLSVLWIFTLLNYCMRTLLPCSLLLVREIQRRDAPYLTQWALLGSAVLMEVPIAMILACRLLPFKANRLANIIAGAIMTL